MNLHEDILELSRELNYLWLVAPAPTDATIKKLIDALEVLSVDALKKELDEDSKEFKAATKSLAEAIAATEKAVADIEKIDQAIATSVKVVKGFDKLLGYAGSLIG